MLLKQELRMSFGKSVGLRAERKSKRINGVLQLRKVQYSSGSAGKVVCRACGAQLEVVVHFSGKVVWPVDPENRDFSGEQPVLRGETKRIRVVCSADVLHDSGYLCVDGVLVEK